MLKFKTENTIIYLLLIYLVGMISRFAPIVVMLINLSVFLYCFAAVVWMIAVRERFITREIRNLFYSIAVLILFLHLSQICKYSAFNSLIWVQRYLWYFYYVPFTLIPLLSFIVSLKIGQSENARLNFWGYATAVISMLLVIIIMTNDLHQSVFEFKDGNLDNINDYHRGIIYYLDMIWGYALITGSCVISMLKSYKRIRRRYVLLIIFVLVSHLSLQGMLYTNIADNFKIFGTVPLTVPMLYNMSFIFFWELGIRYGIIPSNTDYEEIFNIAGVEVLLSDTKGRTVIKSDNARELPEHIKNSVNEFSAVNYGDYKIHLRKITGGYIYWKENVARINALNRELRDTAERLKEENTLLFEEARIKEENARISAVSRIYDDITERLMGKIQRIKDILDGSDTEDEEGFRKNLIYACIIGAYVKRYSNMTLLSKTVGDTSTGMIASKELYLAVKESLEYLSLCDGMTCEVFYNVSGKGNEAAYADMALDVYEAVERCIEILAFAKCTVMFRMTQCDLSGIEINTTINVTQQTNSNVPYSEIRETLKKYADESKICDISVRDDEDETDIVYITILRQTAGTEVPYV